MHFLDARSAKKLNIPAQQIKLDYFRISYLKNVNKRKNR